MRRLALLLLLPACKQNKPPPIDAIELYETFGCVRIIGGKRACFGELPDGTSAPAAVMYDAPVAPAKPSDVPCIMQANGTAKCNGAEVLGLVGIAEIANGAQHTCARLANGLVACWGDNHRHQLADGSTTSRPNPAVVPGLTGVKSITAAGDSTCVVKGTEARCWGANDHGQLGDGTKNEHPVPSPLRFAPRP